VILKQGETGLTTAQLCRQHGITEEIYNRWKAKYRGMDGATLSRARYAALFYLNSINRAYNEFTVQ
jgi:putative transposase